MAAPINVLAFKRYFVVQQILVTKPGPGDEATTSLAPEREKCCVRNSHPYVGNSLGMIILSVFLSVTSTYLGRFFCGEDRGDVVGARALG